MSMAEYRDKFTELSRYTAEEVAEDRKKQELPGWVSWFAAVPADVLSFPQLSAAS
jgi:hypothetical protein